jgi:hypothetical protein
VSKISLMLAEVPTPMGNMVQIIVTAGDRNDLQFILHLDPAQAEQTGKALQNAGIKARTGLEISPALVLNSKPQ